MIAYPDNTFETKGATETELCNASKPLITSIETICTRLIQHGSTELFHTQEDITTIMHQFHDTLCDYMHRYDQWKTVEDEKSIRRIRHALVAMHAAQNQLPPSEPIDSKLNVEFNTQIIRLRDNMKKIGGPDAIATFDNEFTQLMQKHAQSNPTADTTAYRLIRSTGIPAIENNEYLTHELLIDPEFQYKTTDDTTCLTSVHNRINVILKSTYWDCMTDEIRLQPPCFLKVLNTLTEIKEGINDVIHKHKCDKTQLEEVIDLQFIKRRIDQNAFSNIDFIHMFSGIMNIIHEIQSKFQYPPLNTAAYNELLTEMRQHAGNNERWPNIVSSTMRFLIDNVNRIRMETTNKRLRIIAPIIVTNGVEYEKGMFQEKLSTGKLTLENTKKWIKYDITDVNPDLIPILSYGNSDAYQSIIKSAILSLVFNPTYTQTLDKFPETFHMDIHRICNIVDCVKGMASVGSMFAIIDNVLESTIANNIDRGQV